MREKLYDTSIQPIENRSDKLMNVAWELLLDETLTIEVIKAEWTVHFLVLVVDVP